MVQPFKRTTNTLSAVIRKFEGYWRSREGLPEVIREQYPKCPGRRWPGCGTASFTFDFGVDVLLVCETIRRRLPELRRQVQQILEEQQRKPLDREDYSGLPAMTEDRVDDPR